MIFRYPGSKKKVARMLAGRLPACRELREPYFGAGAVTFAAVADHPSIKLWINDRDPGIAALWTSVIRDPLGLQAKIQSFTPSLGAYQDFHASLQDSGGMSELDLGFRKLALHQMSYSGLGLKAGGPIGGRDQKGKQYGIGCRWNATTLCRGVFACHSALRGRCREDRCTSDDALDVIAAAGDSVTLYLDPPYVGAGQELYVFGYTEQDHRDLAAALQTCQHRWVLSYDEHILVRELYAGRPVENLSWSYTINSTAGNKGSELLVFGADYDVGNDDRIFSACW